MGMYSIVTFREVDCPKCGAKIPAEGWQSYDGLCLCEEVPLDDVSNICNMCPKQRCQGFVEFLRTEDGEWIDITGADGAEPGDRETG